jgi:replicative DNA helicase
MLDRIADASAPRPLPHSIEAEQSLLGGMLNSPQACDVAAPLVDERDFFEAVHADIYAWLLDMREQGMCPTPTLLRAQLGARGWADVAGMSLSQYIARLAAEATTIVNVPDFASVVRDLAGRRRIISAAQDAAELAHTASVDARTKDIASSTIERLEEIVGGGNAPRAPHIVSIADAATHALDDLSAAIAGSAPPPITSGLTDLDRRIGGGLHRGEFIVAAARPNMGKTALGVHIALSGAEQGHGVLFVSLEMSSAALAQRALTALAYRMSSGRSRIAYADLRNGRGITEADFGWLRDAQDRLRALPLTIDDRPGLTIAEIARTARRRQRKHGLDLLVLDHLHKIRVSNRYAGNPTAEITELSTATAALAKELDLAILALAQLNRGVDGREDKRPVLSDLRQSGALEQDADLVLFPFWGAYYLRCERKGSDIDSIKQQALFEASKHHYEIIIAKQRQGEACVINAGCDMATNVFYDLAREHERAHVAEAGGAFR